MATLLSRECQRVCNLLYFEEDFEYFIPFCDFAGVNNSSLLRIVGFVPLNVILQGLKLNVVEFKGVVSIGFQIVNSVALLLPFFFF